MNLDDYKRRALYMLAAEELDDLVHEAKSGEAADINNSGVAEQVNYLADSSGALDALLRSLEPLLPKNEILDADDQVITCPNCVEPLGVKDLLAGECQHCKADLVNGRF